MGLPEQFEKILIMGLREWLSKIKEEIKEEIMDVVFDRRPGAGICEVEGCPNDAPWFTCSTCGRLTCKSHHIFRGSVISYCIICSPDKLAA